MTRSYDLETPASVDAAVDAAVAGIVLPTVTPAAIGAETPAGAQTKVDTAVAGITPAAIGAETPAGAQTKVNAAIAGLPSVVASIPTRQLATLKSGLNVGSFDFAAYTGSSTHRVGYMTAATAISDLELVYDNWTLSSATGAGETDNPNVVTYKAAIEYGGFSLPVTFPGGKTSVTLDVGASITSLPVAIEIPASTAFYVRTYVSYTPGTVAVAGVAPDAAVSGSGYGGGDTAYSTGTMTTSSNNTGLVAPTVIYGRPVAAVPMVGIICDSVGYGIGEPTLKNGGFIRRALGTTVANVTLGRPSERASTCAPVNQHYRRFRQLRYCTHAIEQYGINDIGNSQATATIQASRLAIWYAVAQRGVKCYATTITPSTSNDATKEGRRTAINDWIRDGAPILAGVAVATGSNAGGTLRIGAAGHPLVGYFEIADLAETARNSGAWKTGYSGDGTHPLDVGAIALSAGINPALFTV